MTPARIFMYFVYALLLVALVVAGAAAYTGTVPFAPPSGDGDANAEPRLTSFTSGGGGCVAEVNRDGATTVSDADDGAVVTFRGNVSVPDANYRVDSPELVDGGDGNYTIDLTASEVTEKAGRDCDVAQAQYELSVRIPPEAGPTTITLTHDGELVSRVSTGGGSAPGTAETVTY